MKKTPLSTAKSPRLRRQAELEMQKWIRTKASREKRKLFTDNERLLHELEVHQVELELQNSELQNARDRMEVLLEKYTDLYDFAPLGYLTIDEAGMVLEANLMGASLLGVERAFLINHRFISYVMVESRGAFLAFLKTVFAENKHHACEIQLRQANGVPFWGDFRAAPVLPGPGKAGRWCRITFENITNRKLAETALHASEERFRTLFDFVPVAVYSCGATGLIQKFNRKAVDLWGRQPVVNDPGERFCGSFKLFFPDGSFVPHKKCPMALALSGEISVVRDQEIIIERPDGTRINAIVNIYTLKDEQGKIIGAINCFYDITERRQAEAVRHRVEMLAATNQKLEKEIVRRQSVEKTLNKTEQHQRLLLEQSRDMEKQLRELSRQMLRVQEEERKRISRELHDIIAQTLTGINLRLSILQKGGPSHSGSFGRNLRETQKLVEESVDVVHQFARELRPTVLDDLGLIPALHSFGKDFSIRTGLHTRITIFRGIEKFSMTVRTALFRVAQEAMNNTARHAGASLVKIRIYKFPNRICMKIIDDGKAFNVKRTMDGRGKKRLGLLGMRERMEMIGGRLAIESTAGKGTIIKATIPTGNLENTPKKQV